MLHTEPSFSIYATEEELVDDKKRDLEVEKAGEFTFVYDKDERLSEFENLGIGEKENEEIEQVISKVNLDLGLEVDGANGNGVELKLESSKEDEDVEEYYKKMVNEDPFNPLFLKKYARFLQSKGDLSGAEEHYFHATEADPKDGETLMQYAKLVWELHHDQDKASRYFKSAALAAPEDSDVLAAYASFLWQIDEGEEDNKATTHDGLTQRNLEGEEKPVNLEEHYKKMVDENPCDSFLLKNYAHFLQKTKGDLEGAEEYYSRAMLVDPNDGKVLSQYAQLVWHLRHDQDKASSYFERAVEAAPTDSHVLAAHAKFLWEANDEEDDRKT